MLEKKSRARWKQRRSVAFTPAEIATVPISKIRALGADSLRLPSVPSPLSDPLLLRSIIFSLQWSARSESNIRSIQKGTFPLVFATYRVGSNTGWYKRFKIHFFLVFYRHGCERLRERSNNDHWAPIRSAIVRIGTRRRRLRRRFFLMFGSCQLLRWGVPPNYI